MLFKSMFICADPETLLDKRTEFPSVATEIIYIKRTLRNNCHCMVFSYLPQFLYKDIEQ